VLLKREPLRPFAIQGGGAESLGLVGLGRRALAAPRVHGRLRTGVMVTGEGRAGRAIRDGGVAADHPGEKINLF